MSVGCAARPSSTARTRRPPRVTWLGVIWSDPARYASSPAAFANRDHVAKDSSGGRDDRVYGLVGQDVESSARARRTRNRKLPPGRVLLDVGLGPACEACRIDRPPADRSLRENGSGRSAPPDLTAVQRRNVLLDELRESFAVARAIERVEQRDKAASVPAQLSGKERELSYLISVDLVATRDSGGVTTPTYLDEPFVIIVVQLPRLALESVRPTDEWLPALSFRWQMFEQRQPPPARTRHPGFNFSRSCSLLTSMYAAHMSGIEFKRLRRHQELRGLPGADSPDDEMSPRRLESPGG